MVPHDFQLKSAVLAKVPRPATSLSMMDTFIHPGGKRRRVPVNILVQYPHSADQKTKMWPRPFFYETKVEGSTNS